jgi:hypothetical protein
MTIGIGNTVDRRDAEAGSGKTATAEPIGSGTTERKERKE